MALWMGIDGGGSNLRVVVADDDLRIVAEAYRGTANPATVGYETAARHIHEAVRDTLEHVDLATIAGVGIGIAGAANHHSEDWLRTVVAAVLPGVAVVPSSDFEIALVGARGERTGILLLAGTGSVAYGINTKGDWQQIGGWGYLLGDEGGGYWIGLQALKAVTLSEDGRLAMPSQLPERVKERFDLSSKPAILNWMYHASPPSPATIAQLAPLVLEIGYRDPVASQIIEQAAEQLAEMARHLSNQLEILPHQIAFSGGLLTTDNALSHNLTRRLALSKRPESLHLPVIGAALLAKLFLHK